MIKYVEVVTQKDKMVLKALNISLVDFRKALLKTGKSKAHVIRMMLGK